MCWTSFKTIGHSSKNEGPSRKTLRPSWCPKLVTGLHLRLRYLSATSTYPEHYMLARFSRCWSGFDLKVILQCQNLIPKQRRIGIRWRPGQEASLAPPCSNLRSFGSKYTVLKKVAYLWHCWDFRRPPQWFGSQKIASPLPSLVTPLSQERSFPSREVTWLSWQCH